jgi:hypothetical protein
VETSSTVANQPSGRRGPMAALSVGLPGHAKRRNSTALAGRLSPKTFETYSHAR